MPARMRTLRDLDMNEGDRVPEKPSGKVPRMKVKHIPTLCDADACLRLLTRIHNEFYPIIERRGYRVVSVSEMCCCGDGLDHEKGRKRKLKIMGSNVLGYNCTRSARSKTHTIHLRLRDSNNHNRLFSYEEVAGTMAHEMAHCEHGPHNAAFYKLMDEILEQHAVYMAKGIVADKDGFPMNSENAYTLGGGARGNNALEAAQRRQRQQKFMPQGPQKLGGDLGFQSWLAPGQAAGQAAEARRLRDEVWCQPCQASDVIELSSDSEEEDNESVMNDGKLAAGASAAASAVSNDDSKPAAVVTESESEMVPRPGLATQNDNGGKVAAAARPASVVTIDLTLSDGEDDNDSSNRVTTNHAARRCRKRAHEEVNGEWPCSQCTYRNLPGTLVCGMCGKESPVALDNTNKVVAEIRRKDEIEQIKHAEVEESKREFGFNIYGNARQATAKLPHLT